jgi:hypothetical protein
MNDIIEHLILPKQEHEKITKNQILKIHVGCFCGMGWGVVVGPRAT